LNSLFWTDSREWVWATALQFRANLSLEASSSVKWSPALAVTATKKEGVLLYSITEFWAHNRTVNGRRPVRADRHVDLFVKFLYGKPQT